MIALVLLNIIAVVVESIHGVYTAAPEVWMSFEIVSVVFFTIDYVLRVFSATQNPHCGYSRAVYATTFLGIIDLVSFLPFYIELIVMAITGQVYGSDGSDGEVRVYVLMTLFEFFFWLHFLGWVFVSLVIYTGFSWLYSFLNTSEIAIPFLYIYFMFSSLSFCQCCIQVFRIVRIVRLFALEHFLEAFTLLDNVVWELRPNLLGAGVLALLIWMGGAVLFYLFEDDIASVPESLYLTAIYLGGEWARCDFSVPGKVLCVVLCFVGIGLYGTCVGLVCDAFAEVLERRADRGVGVYV